MTEEEVIKKLSEDFAAQLSALRPVTQENFEACFPGAQVTDFRITDKKKRVAEVTLSIPNKGIEVQIEISD